MLLVEEEPAVLSESSFFKPFCDSGMWEETCGGLTFLVTEVPSHPQQRKCLEKRLGVYVSN